MSNDSTTDELYIDFAGQQLVVSSDDPRALEYFRRKYGEMLTANKPNPIGTLSVCRAPDGYVVYGSVELQHPSTLDTLYDWLDRDVFLSFVGSRPDLLWLHAGAVEKNDSAIIISGSSGQGKSTLVTRLYEQGWNVLSDEYAPIRLDTNEVLPFPRTPRRRVFPGRELEQWEFGSFDLEDIDIASHRVRRTPAKLGAMVFPFFKIGATANLERLSAGDGAMEIFRNSTNFIDHRASGIEWVAALVKQITCYRLTYGVGTDAAAVVNSELGGKNASLKRL